MLGIKSESLGSLEKFSHISSSLSGIGIEGEECVQFCDVFGGKDSIFSGDVLTEHSLKFLCLDFSLRHVDISNTINYIKSQARKSSNEVPLTNLHDEADNRMEEQMDAKELQKALYTAIDSLPEKRREVFVLSRFEGKSYKEIAEIMQISVKTVEAQMGKALSTLREFVKNNHKHPIVIALFTIWLGGE